MTTSTNPTARLTLTATERQIILDEYDSYPRGDARRGALLRRYSSPKLVVNARQRERGFGGRVPAGCPREKILSHVTNPIGLLYGLYTSQMAKWRERRKRGEGSLASPPPGPKPAPRNPLADEVARLTRENARLQQQLTNAETIIAIQKKVATLLDLLPTPRSDERC